MQNIFFTDVVCDQKSLETTDLRDRVLFGGKMFHLVTATGTEFLVQLLVILDTLQTTGHFPCVVKFPEQCLVTWRIL